MLQKELAKRLRDRYDTKMDGNGWLEVSSDGIPLCRIKYNGQFLSNADQNLSDEYRSKIADIQDEISTVREYVGLYEHAPQMKAADVSDYRQLAAFGDTVLAATYSEKNGFMFCTWKQNADGDSVFWGDYSPNYEYVKEAFAVRSGLVNKHRLFSENESADLCRCVDFAKGNCETLHSLLCGEGFNARNKTYYRVGSVGRRPCSAYAVPHHLQRYGDPPLRTRRHKGEHP